uniref:Helicase ATP-binding domain-containing protein n=1 Tax=Meloidogyne incognita TaxID=6306 RepID=A0A914M3R4_MELIC
MEIFAENLLSDSARSGTMNGKLIKMLLGKADRPEPPALRANQIGRGVNLINRLGDEQARTAELLLDDVPRVVFAQAPPGTGKTYTAASIMAAILERDPEARILALAPPNIAVTKLVEEMDKAMDNCENKEKMLALFSGNGKIRYAQYLRRITSHLLVTAVDEEELIRALKPTEETHMERRICFATLSFAEQVPNLFSGTTHVVLDESGQAPYSQVLSLMFNMPNLKKMLITGDRRQLKVCLESLPRAVQVGFGLDSVIINLDASDGIG